MKDSPMHDVEQGLPRRIGDVGSSRRPILSTWKFLLPAAAIALAVFLLSGRHVTHTPPATLTYTQLVRAVDAGRVASMSIEPGYGVHGRWKTSTVRSADFVVLYTAADIQPLVVRAEHAGVTISFLRAGDSDAYKS